MKAAALFPLVITLLTGASFFAPSVNAAVLVTYDFAGGSTAGTVTGDTGLLTAGAVSTTYTGGGFSSATATAYAPISSTGTSEATALSLGRYFTFTLTPQAGQTLDLTSFTLDFGGSAAEISQGTTFTSNIVVQSSVGGFGSGNPLLTVTPNSYVSTSASNQQIKLTSATVDVSGTAFDSLTTPVTFRVYLYYTNASGGTGNYSYRLDNIAVQAVPEPGSAVLFGLAVGTTLIFRRRRKA